MAGKGFGGGSQGSPTELDNIRSSGSTPSGELRRTPTTEAGVQTKDRQQNRYYSNYYSLWNLMETSCQITLLKRRTFHT